MRTFIILALIAVGCARSTKVQTEAHAKAAAQTEIEWINVPQFRSSSSAASSTVVSQTSASEAEASAVEMVDAYQGEDSGAASRDVHDTAEAAYEMFKLRAAIIQIKGDIMRKISDLRSSASWVAAVKIITNQFQMKVNNTRAAIHEKKHKLKKLLKKKRQLENLLLQLRLEAKLDEARTDMASLSSALHGVANKKSRFDKNRQQVQDTVQKIKQQLMILNGGSMPDITDATNTSWTDTSSQSGSATGSGSGSSSGSSSGSASGKTSGTDSTSETHTGTHSAAD